MRVLLYLHKSSVHIKKASCHLVSTVVALCFVVDLRAMCNEVRTNVAVTLELRSLHLVEITKVSDGDCTIYS